MYIRKYWIAEKNYLNLLSDLLVLAPLKMKNRFLTCYLSISTTVINDFRDKYCHLLKTNFEPTGHHHLRGSPLPRVCTVLSASAILKCILQVVFCEGAEHRLRFSLITSTAPKWRETENSLGAKSGE
jgi:hypothetical protein